MSIVIEKNEKEKNFLFFFAIGFDGVITESVR